VSFPAIELRNQQQKNQDMDKTTLQALSDLHQARMDDLELMDSIARCLNERIEVLRCLVGFLLENPPSQFSENGDVLEKIKSLVEKDESGK